MRAPFKGTKKKKKTTKKPDFSHVGQLLLPQQQRQMQERCRVTGKKCERKETLTSYSKNNSTRGGREDTLSPADPKHPAHAAVDWQRVLASWAEMFAESDNSGI